MKSTIKYESTPVGCSATNPIIISSDSDSECSIKGLEHTLSTNNKKSEKNVHVSFDKCVMNKAVGYVGGLEEFGDADYSDSSQNGNEEKSHGSSQKSTSCKKCTHTDCYNNMLSQVEGEKIAFTKLLKPYNVGLFLLPDLLREDVFDIIEDGFYAIVNDGYTAEDALSYLLDRVGRLHSNSDLRKIFLQGTLSEDLDG